MSRWFLLIALLIAVLAGCGGYQVKYDEVRTSGSILYPLCERAKQCITDMQRISFKLPLLFKQATCRNYPDYSYTSRIDSLSVTIPDVIANESKMSIGGVYSMLFRAAHARTEYYLPPEEFLRITKNTSVSTVLFLAWFRLIGWAGRVGVVRVFTRITIPVFSCAECSTISARNLLAVRVSQSILVLAKKYHKVMYQPTWIRS